MNINFEFETEYGVFRDCIVLLDDTVLTTEQIEEMKTARLNSWLSFIKNTQDIAVQDSDNGQ